MPAPRVLISDELSLAAVQIFRDRGVEVDVKSGISKDEIERIIANYDGLAVRSATKVTEKLIGMATRLKVVAINNATAYFANVILVLLMT